MGYPSDAFRVSGPTRQARKRLRRGGEAVRNLCPKCESLLLSGGEYGLSDQHTVYAGTLDVASAFRPTHAIMMAERAPWSAVLDVLVLHDGLPKAKDGDRGIG